MISLIHFNDLLVSQIIRGAMPIRMECAPAFNYARSAHETTILADDSVPDVFPHPPSTTAAISANLKVQDNKPHGKVLFKSDELTLDLRYIAECSADNVSVASASGLRPPAVNFTKLDLSAKGHLGEGVCCDLDLVEGQAVTFVLRTPPEKSTHRAKPTQEQADAVGIPLESKYFAYVDTTVWT